MLQVKKFNLKKGDKLDGEGGFCARGRLINLKNQNNKKSYH